jgi:hypothetical protein
MHDAKNLARFITVAIIVFLSVGAGSAEDAARIYVYAQRDTPARSWLPISCDGEVVAEVRRGTFFAINLSPGRHALSLENGVPVSVEVHSGEVSFVRIDWNHEVGRQPIPILASVRPDRASKEMMFLGYADAKRLHSRSVPRTDPRPANQPQFKTREEQ